MIKRDPKIKTILLTGLAPEFTIHNAMTAGVDDCIQKPWSKGELQDVIEELIQSN